MKKSFQDLRSEYEWGSLDASRVSTDPFGQLGKWLDEAIKSETPEPTAMILSTVSREGRPSSRIVLLKELSQEGIVFFTHYGSRKGIDLLHSRYASILFFWPELERQIRMEGEVERTKDEESDRYFDSRPEESRRSAIISPQSRIIPDRDFLTSRLTSVSLPLKRPSDWGGFRLAPNYFEFWQGRENRLHDRLFYQEDGGEWKMGLLAP